MPGSSFSVRPVDGVLLLDKPVGITSNAAIQRVKRLLNAAKAGHVGTLDPLASGLLPVCLGEATKFSAAAFGADKRYEAEILLGVTTTTGDTEGEVTSRQLAATTREQVTAVLDRFTGIIAQTPPMYSALKRGGRPLYAYARRGQSVTLEPRQVTIRRIVLHASLPDRLKISVDCGKGTYIRVLAEDIGRALGCGATLAALRRTTVGAFDLAHAVSLEKLETLPAMRRLEFLRPVDTLVSALPELLLEAGLIRLLVSGQSPRLEGLETIGLIRLYDQSRRFLGLGEVEPGGRILPKRLIAATAIPEAAGGSRITTASS